MSDDSDRVRDLQIGIMMEKVDKLEETQEEILRQQKNILDELSLYKHMLLFIKCLFYSVIAVVAFKFGDIKQIWK